MATGESARTEATPDTEVRSDRRGTMPAGLAWLGGTAIFGIATSAVYATTGLGFPCPFRMATGWDCPFCGGTRMGQALLELDPAAAFWLNPAAFVGLVIATLVGAWLLVELISGHRHTLAGWLRRIARRAPITVNPGTIAITVLAGLVMWTVLRNVILGPLP